MSPPAEKAVSGRPQAPAMAARGCDQAESAASTALSVCVLASGSKGNCVYVSDGTTSILIDAGFPGREIEARMAARGLSPASLSALVLSHEHSDHFRGVGVLSRRFDIPVYAAEKTHRAAARSLGRLSALVHFEPGRSFSIAGLVLAPFSTSHDAADPAGFAVTGAGVKIGLATDLGVVTNLVVQHLKDCRALLLEANHDPSMLMDGPYPWDLKQRIKGRTGHLANEDSRDLLGRVLSPETSHVVLCHLSETNNTPEKALRGVAPALSGHRARLSAAHQDHPGELIVLAP